MPEACGLTHLHGGRRQLQDAVNFTTRNIHDTFGQHGAAARRHGRPKVVDVVGVRVSLHHFQVLDVAVTLPGEEHDFGLSVVKRNDDTCTIV